MLKKKYQTLLIVIGVFLFVVGCSSCNNANITGKDSETLVSNIGEETNGETLSKGNESEKATEYLALDRDLILSLTKYLYDLSVDHDMPDNSFATKIGKIERGIQALHVEFDPSDYYYACAYYNSDHEEDEEREYCCATQYTWIGFRSEDEIQEYYENAKLVVAFQINKAIFVVDILPSEKAVPQMEHFQRYKPEFHNGVNIALPIICHDTFVYLNSSDKNTVYHSVTVFNHDWVTIPCVEFNNQFYFSICLSEEHSNGGRYNGDLYVELDDYYDALIGVMIVDEYSESNEQGTTHYCYGLLEFKDVMNAILK